MRYATLGLLLLPALVQAQTFTDASASLPSFSPSTAGITVVDVDGDGRTDMVFSNILVRQTDDGFEQIEVGVFGGLCALVADYDTPHCLVWNRIGFSLWHDDGIAGAYDGIRGL